MLQSAKQSDAGSLSVYTAIKDSKKAGEFISLKIREEFNSSAPDVVIVFASASYDYEALLKSIKKNSNAKILLGCSSAGEFTNEISGDSSVSAIAIKSDDMKFSAVMAKGLSKNLKQAAKDLVAGFQGVEDSRYPYRTALILTDALAGYTDALIDYINGYTGGTYQLFGGGAGDDAKFDRTEVFLGTDTETDAVVALEILSQKPVGIGVRHGWVPASDPMRATETSGMRLVSLNSIPAADVFADYAKSTDQKFNRSDPVPFFLHHALGIKTQQGHKLRVPLSVNSDGSINCASDIPEGSIVYIMKTSADSAANAAREAADDALLQLSGNEPGVALVFDCVATRLRIGKGFDKELKAVDDVLANVSFAGCNTYGQVSRVDGQFSGFHNCTAVVCVLPK